MASAYGGGARRAARVRRRGRRDDAIHSRQNEFRRHGRGVDFDDGRRRVFAFGQGAGRRADRFRGQLRGRRHQRLCRRFFARRRFFAPQNRRLRIVRDNGKPHPRAVLSRLVFAVFAGRGHRLGHRLSDRPGRRMAHRGHRLGHAARIFLGAAGGGDVACQSAFGCAHVYRPLAPVVAAGRGYHKLRFVLGHRRLFGLRVSGRFRGLRFAHAIRRASAGGRRDRDCHRLYPGLRAASGGDDDVS